MTTSYEAGRLELRLDGAWLRDAVFPIVVDPLMTNNVTLNTWSGSFGQHVDLDVLREDERATENVWVCYTRSVSATDQDLWLFRTQDNMAPAPLIQTFADITTSWGNGTCALAHADSRVVCAFVRVFATTRNVRWHAHHINDLALRTGVGAYLPHSGNWRVDIGGNAANTGATRAMVVYQHESAQPFANGNDSETRAFYIDFAGTTTTTGQGTGTGDRQLFGSSTADVERPRINQVADGLGANHWCVVHQFVSNTNPNDDWDVYIDIWDENGNLRSFTQTTSGNGRHELGPVVAGRGGRYLVSYGGAPVAQVGPTTTILSYEILTQRIDFNGTTISRPHPEYQHLADSTRVLETRDIAFDSNTRCHWLSLNRWGNRVYADKLGYRGQYVTFE